MSWKSPEKAKKIEAAKSQLRLKKTSFDEWKESWKTIKMSKKDYDDWVNGTDEKIVISSQKGYDINKNQDMEEHVIKLEMERRYCSNCGTGLMILSGMLQCVNPDCAKTV